MIRDQLEALLKRDGASIDFGTVALPRANLATETKAYPLPISTLRVWDAPNTVAVATPANDDLGVIYNTFLTAAPSIETGDLKNAGATTRKIGFEFRVPAEYKAGTDLTLRIKAGMKTTVASVSATLDAQVANETNDASVDICATNAQSINSLTAAVKEFTLTGTDVEPGDLLRGVLSVAVNDSGTGTAVIGKLYGDLLEIRCSARG